MRRIRHPTPRLTFAIYRGDFAYRCYLHTVVERRAKSEEVALLKGRSEDPKRETYRKEGDWPGPGKELPLLRQFFDANNPLDL